MYVCMYVRKTTCFATNCHVRQLQKRKNLPNTSLTLIINIINFFSTQFDFFMIFLSISTMVMLINR